MPMPGFDPRRLLGLAAAAQPQSKGPFGSPPPTALDALAFPVGGFNKPPQRKMTPDERAEYDANWQQHYVPPPAVAPGALQQEESPEQADMRFRMMTPAQNAGIAMVRPPSYQAAQMSMPTVQETTGYMEDPVARTMLAPDISSVRYEEPDFMTQPPGEKALEDFAYLQMLSLGDSAPRALQAAWGGIQQAKQERIFRRADYYADLLKTRHRADLEMRNQSMADRQANFRGTQRALIDLRINQASFVQQARADAARARLQADTANAGAQNRLMEERRGEIRAMAGAGPGGQQVSVRDNIRLQEIRDRVTTASEAWTAADSFGNFAKSYVKSNPVGGTGVIDATIGGALRTFGAAQPTIFRDRWKTVRKGIILAYSQGGAGARGIDTAAEVANALDLPAEGAPIDSIADWTERFTRQQRQKMSVEATNLERIVPGSGNQLLKDLNDIGAQTGGDYDPAIRNISSTLNALDAAAGAR